MATRAKPKAPSALNEKIAQGARAAVEAVRQLIAPRLDAVENRLDDYGARIEKIEADPISPDELTTQLVREATPAWKRESK